MHGQADHAAFFPIFYIEKISPDILRNAVCHDCFVLASLLCSVAYHAFSRGFLIVLVTDVSGNFADLQVD